MRPENDIPYWPLITGIAVIAIAATLFIVRTVVIIPVIFLILGVILILSWYYIYTKKKMNLSQKYGQECICPICHHDRPVDCIEQKCKCCTILKNDKIVGHSNTPLQ